MKYIRTEDGVFEWDKFLGISQDYFENNPSEIIKESDNLEELFDEQIVEYKDKSGKVIKREFVNHVYEGEIPEDEPEYYGAIRTSKGLIYVAKLNEKGEWELL